MTSRNLPGSRRPSGGPAWDHWGGRRSVRVEACLIPTGGHQVVPAAAQLHQQLQPVEWWRLVSRAASRDQQPDGVSSLTSGLAAASSESTASRQQSARSQQLYARIQLQPVERYRLLSLAASQGQQPDGASSLTSRLVAASPESPTSGAKAISSESTALRPHPAAASRVVPPRIKGSISKAAGP